MTDYHCAAGSGRSTIRSGASWISSTTEAIPYLLTIFLVWRLYAALGTGHLFDEDYAVYLQQAWNIAHHVAMNEMGIIQYHDSRLPLLYVSPSVYPPLGPLLYAVPVLFFGFNLLVLKTVQLGLLAAGLLLFCYFMLRRWRFTVLEVSASLVVFAGSAQLRLSVNSIGSDLPFIVFLVLALGAIAQLVASPQRRPLAWGACVGAAIFVATDVRMVGVALIPTLAIADFIVHRRLRPAAIFFPPTVSAALWIGQSLVTHSISPYHAMFEYRFFTPVANIMDFYWALTEPLVGSISLRVAQTALWLLGILAVVGVVWEAARGTAVAVFIIVYTVMLLVLPQSGTGARYLLPHLLVFGGFAVRGAALIAELVPRRSLASRALPFAAAALAATWWFLVPAPLPSGDWRFGVTGAPAQQAFAAIRKEIPANAVLAATKTRSFHLFTQRTIIRLPWHAPPEEVMAWLRRYRVTAVVIKTSPSLNRYDYSDCPMRLFCRIAAVTPWAYEVFHNSDYALFMIRPDRSSPGIGEPAPVDERVSPR